MSPTSRIIVLIDMDCFYCQVEELLNPRLKNKPIAVVQYNAWRGGGIIAVNYPARGEGVTRHMRGEEAKKKCPTITLVKVPEVRGKADLTKYREAGKRVADVLQTFTPLLERASVDEAYLDITELVKQRMVSEEINSLLDINRMKNTFIVGCELQDFLDDIKTEIEFSEDNLRLAIGGLITEEIRSAIFRKTGYKCSAGIAHNKILAKAVCSLHKPNKQTILPQRAIEEYYKTIPVHKITSLGGKFGQRLVQDLKVQKMSDLLKFTEKDFLKYYDQKTACWLYNIARGIHHEPVKTKLVSKSMGACKNFLGKATLTTLEAVQHWVNELSEEVSGRLNKDLEENNRKAKQIVVTFTQEIAKNNVSSSRTHALRSYDTQKIAQAALEIINKFCLKADGSYCIKHLGISAGGFEDIKNVSTITSFFKASSSKTGNQTSTSSEIPIPNSAVIGENDNKSQCLDLVENSEIIDKYSDIEENETAFNAEIYSASTDELDEDSDDLEFYNQSKTINKSETFSKPSSFFSKYFTNTEPQLDCLESEDSADFEILELDKIMKKEIMQKCPECNKDISEFEMLSHQDYHFAVKLANESLPPSLNNNANNITNNNNKKPANIKNSKRKFCDISNSPLTTFLKKNIEENNDLIDGQECMECHKKIKLEDWTSHLDYHAAKKLHQELNAQSVAPTIKSKPGNKDLKSFFKVL